MKAYSVVTGVAPRRSRRSQNSSQRSVTDMFAAISKRKSVETEIKKEMDDDEQDTKRPRLKKEGDIKEDAKQR